MMLLLLPAGAWADSEVTITDFQAALIQNGAPNPPQTIPSSQLRMQTSAMDYNGAYQALYLGLKNRLAQIPMLQYNIPYDENTVYNLFNKVVNDNGDLFYVASSFSASGSTQNGLAYFIPQYLSEITQTEIDLFNKKVAYILSKATSGGMSNEDKVLAIHDYLVDNCQYDVTEPVEKVPYISFTAYGAIVNKKAVCQGYAIALNYLLKKLGVNCLYVTSDEMHHGWSMVSLDGLWYHVDATWDDPVTSDGSKWVLHACFLLSDATITTLKDFEHYGWDTSLPKCTSTKYETGYSFVGIYSPFHYKKGLFWYQSGSSYYRTNFSGTSKTSINAQDYIITPKTPYSIYYPIVYDTSGNVVATTLSNIGGANISIDKNQTGSGQLYMFIAYYGSNNKLLLLDSKQVGINSENYDLASFADSMPIGATGAKIFLWDVNNINNLAEVYVQ